VSKEKSSWSVRAIGRWFLVWHVRFGSLSHFAVFGFVCLLSSHHTQLFCVASRFSFNKKVKLFAPKEKIHFKEFVSKEHVVGPIKSTLNDCVTTELQARQVTI
jgi:hypothetical protein